MAIRSLAALIATAAVLMLAAPAHAGDPGSNTQPSGLYNCDVNSSLITAACLNGAVSDFNRARAKEGLGPLYLPSDFSYQPVSVQLLILANIDRADRGMPTFVGLSKTLNSYALQGAQNASDPPFPSWAGYGAGNWVGSVNSLWGQFEWMYDDGPGSTNLDCRSAGGSGCWGHRHNVLVNWPNPMVMGAGVANNGAATIVLGQDTHDVADAFQWWREYSKFNHRNQPSIAVAGGTGALAIALYRYSQTTVTVQKYYSGAWHNVLRKLTPGAVSNGLTWKARFLLSKGTYRVVSDENSRFLKALSKNITVH